MIELYEAQGTPYIQRSADSGLEDWGPQHMYVRGQTLVYRAGTLRIMPVVNNPRQKISELIDRIEQIREELLAIQKLMERMETVSLPRTHIAKGKRN
jgi:hypothetical protein